MRYGLIAGNGKFPFLVVEGARRAGVEVAVAAIREETDPALERIADRFTWVSIGQLGRMIRFFKREGVEKAIMAGQVKHVQIFSGALPDVRMLKMLISLPRRNTDALIGGVAAELAREGIELIDSTYFLKDHLPQEGVLSRRSPDERVTPEVAREVAERLAVTVMLAGAIAPLGSSYVMTVEATNARTGDTLAREQVQAASREDVLRALGRGGTSLRKKLGESVASIQKFDRPLQEATTSSLEALKLFTQGRECMTQVRYAGAIPFLESALEL
ncbi:MAG: hypothetical protein H7Z38_19660, partial [Rubrivivax sp.]|nr:hypothetical protein [Pyrinomonadaceae bacterium]